MKEMKQNFLALKQGLAKRSQKLRRQGEIVLRASYAQNLERIYYLTLFALPLHLLLIRLFLDHDTSSNASVASWRLAVLILHASLFALNASIFFAARTLRRRKPMHLGRLLPYLFTLVVLSGSLALTLVDQWIGTNITALIIGTIIVGTSVLLRPWQAFVAYAITFFLFTFLLPSFSSQSEILLSNQINGLTACLVGLVLSLLMWINRSKLHQRDQQIARQQGKLRRQAYHDPLTGLANRRLFDELVKSEIAAMQRKDHVSSLIMLDIDHFKSVNDRFGHVAGDRIIDRLAHRLADRLRASDTIARFGGEEFIILLPETSVCEALQLAETLRALIEDRPFTTESGPLKITASFGVAALRRTANLDLADFYREADQALYLAKQNGRNRVERHLASRKVC